MAKRYSIEFEGFDEVIRELEKMNGDVRGTTEDALKQTKRYVHKKAGAAMNKHNRTFRTVRALDKNSSVEWQGDVAGIDVGFNIDAGGLASIFLMYGTPRMAKDQQLYNAFYSKKTADEIKKLQEEIFMRQIARGL